MTLATGVTLKRLMGSLFPELEHQGAGNGTKPVSGFSKMERFTPETAQFYQVPQSLRY